MKVGTCFEEEGAVANRIRVNPSLLLAEIAARTQRREKFGDVDRSINEQLHGHSSGLSPVRRGRRAPAPRPALVLTDDDELPPRLTRQPSRSRSRSPTFARSRSRTPSVSVSDEDTSTAIPGILAIEVQPSKSLDAKNDVDVGEDASWQIMFKTSSLPTGRQLTKIRVGLRPLAPENKSRRTCSVRCSFEVEQTTTPFFLDLPEVQLPEQRATFAVVTRDEISEALQAAFAAGELAGVDNSRSHNNNSLTPLQLHTFLSSLTEVRMRFANVQTASQKDNGSFNLSGRVNGAGVDSLAIYSCAPFPDSVLQWLRSVSLPVGTARPSHWLLRGTSPTMQLGLCWECVRRCILGPSDTADSGNRASSSHRFPERGGPRHVGSLVVLSSQAQASEDRDARHGCLQPGGLPGVVVKDSHGKVRCGVVRCGAVRCSYVVWLEHLLIPLLYAFA